MKYAITPPAAGPTCTGSSNSAWPRAQRSQLTPASRTTPSWTRLIATTRTGQPRTRGSVQPGVHRSSTKHAANTASINGSTAFTPGSIATIAKLVQARAWRKFPCTGDPLIFSRYRQVIPGAAMTRTAAIVQGLRSTLRQRGMTYRQLAAAIGVSEPTVKRDLGRGDFPLSRLDRICDVLDVSLAELIEGGTAALTELDER